MSGVRWAVVVAAAVVAVAVLALALRGGGSEAPSPIAKQPLSVSTDVSPRAVLFGDPVVATVEVLLDRRAIKPESLAVDVDFAPWKPAATPVPTRIDSGHLVRLTYRYSLSCVTSDCLPAGAEQLLQFPSGQVRYGLGGRLGRVTDTFSWPQVNVVSRLSEADVRDGRWYADLTKLPAVSYRVAPGTLAALLLSGAALLVLLGALLALLALPRRVAPEADLVTVTPPTRLELALDLARETVGANGQSPDARKALETLARELGAAGLARHESEARRLAWSSGHPSQAEVEELIGAVRGELGGAS